jgi:XTP/dITP diphosphohydrolase
MIQGNIRELVIATRNEGKIRELQNLFGPLPVKLVSLNEFVGIGDIPETGSTFMENAQLKASGYAKATGQCSLADDSGLEVAALGGAPGVLSARYAGENSSFPEKIAALLDEVRSTGSKDMRATFTCSMAVADSGGKILFCADGVCNGTIGDKPRGSHGFGYDPIFVPEGSDKTFGELSDQIKQEISHRALAAKKIFRYLLDFIEV